jgi:stearoyl-CoA desaturase (delta-9 desaturase)
MLRETRKSLGHTDMSDLSKNRVMRWQLRWHLPLIVGMGMLLLAAVCGVGWGDWRGGFVYAAAICLLFVHHVSLSS